MAKGVATKFVYTIRERSGLELRRVFGIGNRCRAGICRELTMGHIERAQFIEREAMTRSLDGNVLPYKGTWPQIAEDVFVAPGAFVIGDVEIGSGSSVWFNSVVRGDDQPIRIGERVNIQDGTVVHVHTKYQGTFIGDDVTIGHMALLHACTIESRAFVGMGSIVLDMCTVESGAMLAAGSLLTTGKTVKSGELWAGRPARFMRELSQEEIDGFAWSFESYVERSEEYREEFTQLSSTRRRE